MWVSPLHFQKIGYDTEENAPAQSCRPKEMVKKDAWLGMPVTKQDISQQIRIQRKNEKT